MGRRGVIDEPTAGLFPQALSDTLAFLNEQRELRRPDLRKARRDQQERDERAARRAKRTDGS